MTTPSDRLRREDVGAVRLLTLHRPEKRNALDEATVAALREALREAEAEEGVRALVVTGTGPVFCSGIDLKDLAAASEGPMERHQRSARALAALYAALVTSPLPIVAAVGGPAVAGGAGLVLTSDLAIAAQSATIAFTEVRLGFVPALVGMLLARHVGEKATRELLLRATPIDSDRAHALGLVNEVVADHAVLERALAVAAELAAHPEAAIATTKRLLASSRTQALEDGLRFAAEANAAARATDALRTGVAAFVDRQRGGVGSSEGGADAPSD
jgi:methylglutaconyl-CoA hydratase